MSMTLQSDQRSPIEQRPGRHMGESALAGIVRLVTPSPDVSELVRRLLDHFGGLARVVSASREELLMVPGMNTHIANQLRSHHRVAIEMQRCSLEKRSLISNTAKLQRYLKVAVSHSNIEVARLLLLDPRNGLISDVELAHGTTNELAIYPAEVLRLAIFRRATAVILVHNHPSGDPKPSDADIAMTQRIQRALEPVDIVLHDHVIVGRRAFFSFARAGLLRR